MSPPNDLKAITSTSRDAGAVGKDPLVYRQFLSESLSNPKLYEASILDFGAGKTARHTLRLRQEGFGSAVAYDLPPNCQSVLHDANALRRTYDVVLASNVINVIPDREQITRTFNQICLAVSPGGMLIINYPAEPRKSTLSNEKLLQWLNDSFEVVKIIKGPARSKGTLLVVAECPMNF